MPTFSKVSHISFSVRDADASAQWWAALLELTEIDRVSLDEWLARFEQLDVTHSPIAEAEYGAVLAFKDPDGIQFETFFKADHP